MKRKLVIVPFSLLVTLIFSSCATGIDESEVAPIYYNLGNAYMELGDYEKASEAFTQAIALDETLSKATFNLAKVYIEQKNYEEAVILLEGFLEDEPENSIILSTLGYVYSLLGDDETAVGIYDQIIRQIV